MLAPRLLAAFGSQPGALRQCGGSARLQWDRAGNGTKREKEVGQFFVGPVAKFLRQSFHEWAGHSIAHSPSARSYYTTTAGARQGASWRCEGWPSNGYASFSDAGKIGWLIADRYRGARQTKLTAGRGCRWDNREIGKSARPL